MGGSAEHEKQKKPRLAKISRAALLERIEELHVALRRIVEQPCHDPGHPTTCSGSIARKALGMVPPRQGNRLGDGDDIPRCSNTDANGVCMYVGPCLECHNNRARSGR